MHARRLLATLACAAALPAAAFDRFEIQVYEAEINEPGHFGLELHSNFTSRGSRTSAYPGEIPPWHTARFTLEPAVGVTSWLELGAYLQLFDAPAHGFQYAGSKVRAKLLAPKLLGEHFFLGLNVEVGWVVKELEQDQWANELRPFLGWQDGWLLVDANPIIGLALSGKDRFRPVFEPAAKVAVNTQLGFAVGAEYYAELGFIDDLLPARGQSHYLFGVMDLVEPHGGARSHWEINLAVGGEISGPTAEQLIVKTIIGRSF